MVDVFYVKLNQKQKYLLCLELWYKFESLLIRSFLPNVDVRLENFPWKSPGLLDLAYDDDPASQQRKE